MQPDFFQDATAAAGGIDFRLPVISIRQPWAWLIVNGWKNIENRTWPTRVRGPVLIHAGKGMTEEEYEAALMFIADFAPSLRVPPVPPPAELHRGGIVGMATILDCVTRHSSEWFTGDFGFVLTDARPMPFYPCRGALGFFRVKGGGA